MNSDKTKNKEIMFPLTYLPRWYPCLRSGDQGGCRLHWTPGTGIGGGAHSYTAAPRNSPTSRPQLPAIMEKILVSVEYKSNNYCFRPRCRTVRLYWARDKMGYLVMRWILHESCLRCRIDRSTCWSAVEHGTSVIWQWNSHVITLPVVTCDR